jgi:hypothetical protein
MTTLPSPLPSNVINHSPEFNRHDPIDGQGLDDILTAHDLWLSYFLIQGELAPNVANITALRALVDHGTPGAGEVLVVNNQKRLVDAVQVNANETTKGFYIFKTGDTTTDIDGSSSNIDTDGIVQPTPGNATGRWTRWDAFNSLRRRGVDSLRTLFDKLLIDLSVDGTIHLSDEFIKVLKRSAGTAIKGIFNAPIELLDNIVSFTVDDATDIFTATAHGLQDGDEVIFSNSGGALPTGLSAATTYYIISATANTFKVSTTKGGSAVNITSTGTGTNYFTDYQDLKIRALTSVRGLTVNGASSLQAIACKDLTADGNIIFKKTVPLTATFTADAGTNFATSVAHGLVNTDRVILTTTTTLPAGLSLLTTYFVVNKTTDTFQFSSTEGGTAIDITDTGTGTHTWTEQPAIEYSDLFIKSVKNPKDPKDASNKEYVDSLIGSRTKVIASFDFLANGNFATSFVGDNFTAAVITAGAIAFEDESTLTEAQLTNHPGAWRFSTSAGGSGRGAVIVLGTPSSNGQLVLVGGESCEFIFMLLDLATATNQFGWFDNRESLTQNDGIYLEVPETGVAVLKTILNGVPTVSGTIANLVVNTWYRATIELNTAKTAVVCNIYNSNTGALLGTVTNSATIVDDEALVFGFHIINTTASLAETTLDYIRVEMPCVR